MIDSLREHAKARVHQLRVSTSSLYSFFFYPFVSLNLLTPRMTNSKFKTIQLVVLKHTFLIPDYWSSQMVASSKVVHGIKCYNHLVFLGEWKGCVWELVVYSQFCHLYIACKELKIAQIAQITKLFQLLNSICAYSSPIIRPSYGSREEEIFSRLVGRRIWLGCIEGLLLAVL